MNWELLPISPSVGDQLPSLLIAASFTRDTYSVHLTDLTNIWREGLDHSAILNRSREENTSIDPTDDDQLAILLEKLQHGLAGVAADAALALTIHTNGVVRPALTLSITVDLPGGLAPLQWPLHLTSAPQALFTSQLVIPLIRAQRARLREIASLKEVLADKDHVIQKVVDKLEAQGTDLAEAFPQVAAVKGRKADRKRAEGRVKGLGVFKEAEWRKSLDGEEERNVGKLIGETFGDGGFVAPNTDPPTAMDDDEDGESWWEGIKGITINLKTGNFSTKTPTKSKSRKPPTPKDYTKHSAFQVEATPPRKASPAPKQSIPQSKPVQDDDTTDEDGDLDAPSQVSNIRDSFDSQAALRSRPHKPLEKQNAPSSKKNSPQTASPNKATPPPPQSPGDETEDDATEEESPQPPPLRKSTLAKQTKSPSPLPMSPPRRGKLGKVGNKAKERVSISEKEPIPSPPQEETVIAKPPPPRRVKLGKIGGKKKEASPIPELDPEPEPDTEPATQISPTKRKLGMIGRHVRKSTPAASQHGHDVVAGQDEDGDGERGIATVKEETPPPRETEEERADGKREKLKMELDEKARAPVKKKRKF